MIICRGASPLINETRSEARKKMANITTLIMNEKKLILYA